MPQDDHQASTWFRRAAERGNADAQVILGLRYEGGRGVPRDHRQAIVWLRRAAEQGHAVAQAVLGRMDPGGGAAPAPQS